MPLSVFTPRNMVLKGWQVAPAPQPDWWAPQEAAWPAAAAERATLTRKAAKPGAVAVPQPDLFGGALPVVAPEPAVDWIAALQATPVYAGDGMHIYRLGRAEPRAFVAERVKPIDGEQALADRQTPEYERGVEALVEEAHAARLSPALRNHAPSEFAAPASARYASIAAYDDNRVVIDAASVDGGLLVLHDLYYPGWEALVDGAPAPIVKADLLFRGVEIPAGRHRVEFVFRPLSFANLKSAAMSLAHR